MKVAGTKIIEQINFQPLVRFVITLLMLIGCMTTSTSLYAQVSKEKVTKRSATQAKKKNKKTITSKSKGKRGAHKAKSKNGNVVDAKSRGNKNRDKRTPPSKGSIAEGKRGAHKAKTKNGNVIDAKNRGDKNRDKRTPPSKGSIEVGKRASSRAKSKDGNIIESKGKGNKGRDKRTPPSKGSIEVGERAAKKAKRTQKMPVKSEDGQRRLSQQKLENKNTVPVGERASKRAKRTHGIPVERSQGVIRKRRDELGSKNLIEIGKRDALKAKRHQKSPIEWKLPVIRKNHNEGSNAITPKVPVIDHRKKNLEMNRQEKKLMIARMPKRQQALPKKNPIEYTVPTNRQIERRSKHISLYKGNMKMPTPWHAGHIARQKSRMLLNFSGKLNIARPANDRKQYYKLSRKTSTYMGDLKVRWLHYHHRHPSLWRMGRRRDKASSGAVWRNRKMPKRSKYDPNERKIWQFDASSTY